jgi:hypothetical protein
VNEAASAGATMELDSQGGNQPEARCREGPYVEPPKTGPLIYAAVQVAVYAFGQNPIRQPGGHGANDAVLNSETDGEALALRKARGCLDLGR